MGDDSAAQAVQVPLHGLSLQHSRFDWNFTTTPQPALENRTLNYPRGKVFGGSTTISASFPHCEDRLSYLGTDSYLVVDLMTYVRGPLDDYNRWARVTGEDSWAWDNLEPFMRKVSIDLLVFSSSVAHSGPLEDSRHIVAQHITPCSFGKNRCGYRQMARAKITFAWLDLTPYMHRPWLFVLCELTLFEFSD